MSLVGVAQYATVGSGMMLVLLGIVNVAKQTAGLCEPIDAENDEDSESCFGPGLQWNTNDEKFLDDNNGAWRELYSVAPARAGRELAPLLLGMYLLLVHVQSFPDKYDLLGIAQSWGRMSFFLLFAALFGAFGYAGNLGIIAGFAIVFASALALSIEFQYADAPLSLEKEPPAFGGYFANSSGGTTPLTLANIAVKLSIVAALLTLFIGFATVVQRLPGPCVVVEDGAAGADAAAKGPKDDKGDKDDKGPGGAGADAVSSTGGSLSCVGPGLFWADDGVDFAEDLNGDFDERWRTFFSLEPEVFVDNFTPLIFGIVSIIVVFSATRLLWLSSSWARVMLWHLLLAFVANFGYAGNLGIITGLISSTVAVLAFFLILYKDPPSERRADMHYLDDIGWSRKSFSSGEGGTGPAGRTNVVANSPWHTNNNNNNNNNGSNANSNAPPYYDS